MSAGGRPSSYDPAYCEMLIQHMSQGLSFESFGADIEVCKKTLYNWTKEYPEFLHAKEIGTVKSMKYWEDMGMVGILGGSGGINASVWIFNMKNRFGWRDKKDVELTGMKPTIIKRRNGEEIELGMSQGETDDDFDQE